MLRLDVVVLDVLVEEALARGVEHDGDCEGDGLADEALLDDLPEVFGLLGKQSEQQEGCADGHLHSREEHQYRGRHGLLVVIAGRRGVVALALEPLVAHIAIVHLPAVERREEEHE